MKDFSSHQKEKKKKKKIENVCDNMTPDLLISRLNFFFIQGCFERAKQSLSLLAVVVFPRQMDTLRAHTHKHTLEHKHTALPVGAEFLILKYTAINQTPLPRAPARLSQ